MTIAQNEIEKLIEEFKLTSCVECGKCTASCPMTEIFNDYSSSFSPRGVIEKTLLAFDILRDKGIWYCLTCDECTEKCPQGVKFRDFINSVRTIAIQKGLSKLGLFCKRCGQYFLPAHTLEYIKTRLTGEKKGIDLLYICPRCRKYDYSARVKGLLPARKRVSKEEGKRVSEA